MAKPGSIKWDQPASETLDIGDVSGTLTLRQWARAQKHDGVSLGKIAKQVGCASQTLAYAVDRPDGETNPAAPELGASIEAELAQHPDGFCFTTEHGATEPDPEATADGEPLLTVPELVANAQAVHQERIARIDAVIDARRVALVQAEEASFRSFIRRQDLEDEFDQYVAGWMDREEAMA